MANVDIEKLKRIELDILAKVDEVCNKLNIEYFLMGGTLLGAVRHKGFIPWDDDIDIIMRREDYDKFIKEAQVLLPTYYFLQTGETDPNYLANFAKIRDSRTTFWETSVIDFKINHGVYIDVFPLDYYPLSNVKLFKALKIIVDRRILSWYHIKKSSLTFRGFMCDIVGRFLMPTKTSAIFLRNKIYKHVKRSSLVANLGGAWGEKEIFPLEYFSESIKVPFEGLTCTVPAEYDLILKQMYGDYMQMPPKEKQVSHHFTEVIDLEKSYQEYQSQYLK